MNSFTERPANLPAVGIGWLKRQLKWHNGEKEILRNCQAEVDRLNTQIQSTDVAKTEWVRVQKEYGKTGNEERLVELDAVGHKGILLRDQITERNHVVRQLIRRAPVEAGCLPIYARLFTSAADIVLGEIKRLEADERKDYQAYDVQEYVPSLLLSALVQLAERFRTDANNYERYALTITENSGAGAVSPKNALRELFPEK
jgi:hypothetical protein